MLNIKFRYRDAMSNWEWRIQSCTVSSIEECKRIYGLGIDCEYEILEVKKVNTIQRIIRQMQKCVCLIY